MKLRAYRKKHHMSQQVVANRLGVDVTTVSKYETQDILPSLIVMFKINKMSDGAVTMEDFVNGRCERTSHKTPVPAL